MKTYRVNWTELVGYTTVIHADSYEEAKEIAMEGGFDSCEPDGFCETEVDSIEVRDMDEPEEDEGCPKNDPSCEGRAEDCHDACEDPEQEPQAPKFPEPSKYEIQHTLILTTGHVREETSQALFDSDGMLSDSENASVGLASVYELGEYGWLLHVLEECSPEDLRRNELSDLANIVELARSLGCDWIRLDRDGPTYESLPKYDW